MGYATERGPKSAIGDGGDVEFLEFCAVCQSGDLCQLENASDQKVFVTDGGELDVTIGVGACAACGTIQLNPRMGPRKLANYYSRQSRLPREHIDPKSPFSKMMDQQSELVLKHKKLDAQSKALEVGCAEGFMLERLREHVGQNLQVFGIEPSRIYLETARKRVPGIKLFAGMLEDATFDESSFDLILMRHVLEHLTQPTDALRRIHSLLDAKGALYIEVPDSSRPVAGINRYFHHEHLSYFTKETLEFALSLADLRPVHMEQFGGYDPGSGFSYPVLRTLAVKRAAAKLASAAGQADVIWQRFQAESRAFERDKIAPLRRRLRELKAIGARVGVFGAGPHTMSLLGALEGEGIPWKVLLDNNPNKNGKTMRSVPIRLPSSENADGLDAIVLSSQEFEQEMGEQCRKLVPNLEIIPIYGNR